MDCTRRESHRCAPNQPAVVGVTGDHVPAPGARRPVSVVTPDPATSADPRPARNLGGNGVLRTRLRLDAHGAGRGAAISHFVQPRPISAVPFTTRGRERGGLL